MLRCTYREAVARMVRPTPMMTNACSADQLPNNPTTVGKGNKMIAQITTYIDARGFGFLTDSAGEQYFFHVSNDSPIDGIVRSHWERS